MTKETLLMQYQFECLSAIKSVANIDKPFEKAFVDTMKSQVSDLDFMPLERML